MSRQSKALRALGVVLAIGSTLTAEGQAFVHDKTGEPLQGFFPVTRGGSNTRKSRILQSYKNYVASNTKFGDYQGRKAILHKSNLDGQARVKARHARHMDMPKLFHAGWEEGHHPFLFEGNAASRWQKAFIARHKQAVRALKDTQWRWQQTELKHQRLERELLVAIDEHKTNLELWCEQLTANRKYLKELLALDPSQQAVEHHQKLSQQWSDIANSEYAGNEEKAHASAQLVANDDRLTHGEYFKSYEASKDADIASSEEARKAIITSYLTSKRNVYNMMYNLQAMTHLLSDLWWLGLPEAKNAEMEAFYIAYPVRKNPVRQYA